VFGVTAQPSYAFVNDSGEITRQVGALPDEDFLAIIEELTQN
jgi:thioredoxin-related protein